MQGSWRTNPRPFYSSLRHGPHVYAAKFPYAPSPRRLHGKSCADEQQHARRRHQQPQSVSPALRSGPFDVSHSPSLQCPPWERRTGPFRQPVTTLCLRANGHARDGLPPHFADPAYFGARPEGPSRLGNPVRGSERTASRRHHCLDRLRQPDREGDILRDHRWRSAGVACCRSRRGVAARDRVAPLL